MGKALDMEKTVQQALEVCLVLLNDRLTLPQACDKVGLTSYAFRKALLESPHVAARYSLAREALVEIMLDEVIEIADTDIDANRARNRIEARKFLIVKLNPKKYGDRLSLDVEHKVSIVSALTEARNRVDWTASSPPLELSQAEPLEFIDASHDAVTDEISVDDDDPLLE